MAYHGRDTNYEKLKAKLVARHQEVQKKLWHNHAESLGWLSTYSREMALASVSSLMLLSTPIAGIAHPVQNSYKQSQYLTLDPVATLTVDLAPVLPKTVEPLTPDQEDQIAQILSRHTGLTVVPELNGIRLNRTYGYIGQEQHLARYPGDTIDTHFESDKERMFYQDKGMAPGLGAWGYFASSRQTMTVKDALREKWYIAAPTFLAPGFAEHTGAYVSFFKYRKMLVLNPENGKAVVADIGDAGPGESTGKHLGGSPEVMKYLERVDGARRGPVLYFFIDDPEDTVPLGPIQLREQESNV